MRYCRKIRHKLLGEKVSVEKLLKWEIVREWYTWSEILSGGILSCEILSGEKMSGEKMSEWEIVEWENVGARLDEGQLIIHIYLNLLQCPSFIPSYLLYFLLFCCLVEFYKLNLRIKKNLTMAVMRCVFTATIFFGNFFFHGGYNAL